MTTSLQVVAYSNSSKPCDLAGYINADDADRGVLVNKDHRMVAWFEVVRMILSIHTHLAAVFKEYFSTYSVKRDPFFAFTR